MSSNYGIWILCDVFFPSMLFPSSHY